MKTAIVGAGAMGCLFGGLLAEAGVEVWLVDVRPEPVAALRDRGLVVERGGQRRTVRVAATADPAEVGGAQLVIVLVKAVHTPAAARTAAGIAGKDGLVLTLQNGMGNAEVLARTVSSDRVLAGTTAHGATLLGPGAIRHAGSGPTVLGPWAGADAARAERVAALLRSAGIEAEAVDDPRPALWHKLLVNVGINAITALTGVRNGQLLDLVQTRDLVAAAVTEAAAVARRAGVAVDGDPVDRVLAIARATAENRSSMGQDVDAGRPTEIAAINGFVVSEADRLGVPAPVNRTLAALVETLQAHAGQGAAR